jgi:hypothetical protein
MQEISQGLAVEDELPIATVPDVPLWSENYCFDGYDPESGVGFWLHVGRSSQDPRLWREQVYVSLSHGVQLVRKAYGAMRVESGAGAAGLTFSCIDPFKRWRLRYFGTVRRTSEAELLAGSLADGIDELLELDLSFEATTPIWNIGAKSAKQIWCTAHYEQAGVCTGFLRAGRTTTRVQSRSYRDHSRGPRELRQMDQHAWIHGSFPDGRAFGMFEFRVLGAPKRNLSEAFVYDGERMHEAMVHSVPLFRSEADAGKPYVLELVGDFGAWRLSGRPELRVPQSFGPPNELFAGVARGLASHLTYQESTRFALADATGFGHTERTLRLPPG